MTAPTISGITGTISHGNAVTIAGANFGTKSTAAPTIWDNCAHGQSIATRWDDSYPNTGGATINMDYHADTYSQGFAHSHMTKFATGSHDGSNSPTGGNFVGLLKNMTFANPTVVYISHYLSSNAAWVFGENYNHKYFHYNGANGGPQELPNNWYGSNAFPTSPNGETGAYQHGLLDDSGYPTGSSLVFNDQNGHDRGWNTNIKETHDRPNWIKCEWEIKLTSGTTGYIKYRQDGAVMINYAGKTDGYSGTGRSIVIGGYHGVNGVGDQNPDNRRFYGDIYVELATLQRCVLANNATFSSATVIENFIPTAWSDTSITATVNLGAFTSGTVYAFVFNAAGEVNATGFPLTIGAGGAVTATTGITPRMMLNLP